MLSAEQRRDAMRHPCVKSFGQLVTKIVPGIRRMSRYEPPIGWVVYLPANGQLLLSSESFGREQMLRARFVQKAIHESNRQ